MLGSLLYGGQVQMSISSSSEIFSEDFMKPQTFLARTRLMCVPLHLQSAKKQLTLRQRGIAGHLPIAKVITAYHSARPLFCSSSHAPHHHIHSVHCC
jgi:hypothetical protein